MDGHVRPYTAQPKWCLSLSHTHTHMSPHTGIAQPDQGELRAQWERSREAEGNGPVLVVARAGGGGSRRPLVAKATLKEGAFVFVCVRGRDGGLGVNVDVDEMRYARLGTWTRLCSTA